MGSNGVRRQRINQFELNGIGKKIAMISEHASPLADPGSVDSGGQNVYVAQTARHLARQGYQVDVFTRRDNEDHPDVMVWEDGVRIIHVPAGPPTFVRKEDLLSVMYEFSEYMIQFIQQEEAPYRLIHAHFWMSALVAADIKRALNIPFVVTFHALGRVRRQYQGKEDGFPDIRFVIEDRVVAEADRIIAECLQDEQDLLCLYGAEPTKIRVIPCGFDTAEMWSLDKTVARRALGLPEDEFIVLQLGRMVPRKGVDNVVRGFARLVQDGSAVGRLIIVGGGSETPDPIVTPEIGRLQKIAAEEGVADRILFTGRRGRNELKKYYSAADVFVSTPWYEPFGITPVEAMACGTPVIGANVGGIQYTVVDGETGFLVPPRDPDALADRLIYLYQHPDEREAMAQAAQKRANKLFTWQQVCTSLAALYEDVIDQANTSKRLLEQVCKGSVEALVLERETPNPLDVVERSFETAVEAMRRSQVVLGPVMVEAANVMVESLAKGNRILVCGNGGSAADAQHFAAEFVGRFLYPERKGLPVMALTADTAFLTAWANDVGYEQIFARQVEAFGRPGDVLIGISTSGRSLNLIEAFRMARSMGITCLALLGGDGGDLLSLADIAIVVPAVEAQRIQEVQTLVLHVLCELTEVHFLPSLSEEQTAWDLRPAIPVQIPRTK